MTRTVHDKNGQSIGEAIVNPVVIIEVLSDSTKRYDRDAKFDGGESVAVHGRDVAVDDVYGANAMA